MSIMNAEGLMKVPVEVLKALTLLPTYDAASRADFRIINGKKRGYLIINEIFHKGDILCVPPIRGNAHPIKGNTLPLRLVEGSIESCHPGRSSFCLLIQLNPSETDIRLSPTMDIMLKDGSTIRAGTCGERPQAHVSAKQNRELLAGRGAGLLIKTDKLYLDWKDMVWLKDHQEEDYRKKYKYDPKIEYYDPKTEDKIVFRPFSMYNDLPVRFGNIQMQPDAEWAFKVQQHVCYNVGTPDNPFWVTATGPTMLGKYPRDTYSVEESVAHQYEQTFLKSLEPSPITKQMCDATREWRKSNARV